MKSINKIFLPLIAASLLSTACNKNAPELISPLTSFNQTIQTQSQWTVAVGHGTDKNYLKLEPVVANRFVYAADFHGDVMAVDRRAGQSAWQTHVDHHITSGVGEGNGVVAVGTLSGYVYAMNEYNGKIKWRARVPGEILATPTIANNTMFLKTMSGRLYAFDAQTGRKRWSYRSKNPRLILRSDSKVATAHDLAIAGFADGSVAAFDQHTGRRVWHVQLAVPHGINEIERMVDITADPYVENGVLYITSYQGRFAAIDIDTGRILWKKDLSAYAGLSVGPNAIYVSDSKSKVWALSKRNGMVLWHNDLLEGRTISGPAYSRGKIVVGDKQGYVHWLAVSDGHFLARNRTGKDPILTPPVTAGADTYFYTSRGHLISYTTG